MIKLKVEAFRPKGDAFQQLSFFQIEPLEPAQEAGFARALAGQMRAKAQAGKPDLL